MALSLAFCSTRLFTSSAIPSAQNSGIKADIDLAVDEGNVEDVGLLFDADATFRHVVGTGNGRVLMPPVLKARPMNQNQNG